MAMMIIERLGQPSGLPRERPTTEGANLGFRQILAKGGATCSWLPRAVHLAEDGSLRVTKTLIRFRAHRDTRRALELLHS